MESDHNSFPEFKLFNPLERLKKIGRFMFGLQEAPAYMSEHYPGQDEWQRLLDESQPQVDRLLESVEG